MMYRRFIKNIKIFLLILLEVFILGYAVYCGDILKSEYNSVSIRLEDSRVTIKQLEKALENEKIKEKELSVITAWSSDKKCEIYSKDMYGDEFLNNDYIKNKEEYIKKEKVQIYEVYGQCNYAYPLELCDGNYPLSDDFHGCIIDENTAYNLFGTKYCVGNSIFLNNKTYYVRGAAKTDKPTMMIQIDDEDHEFSNIELFYSDDERSRDMAEKFMIQNGLSDEYKIFDGEFYGKIAVKTALIPGWILMFYMIKMSICSVYKRKMVNFKMFVRITACILFVGLLIYITEFKFYYPVRLIPSKWSDFKFWTDKFKELKILIEEFTYMMPYPRDVMMVQYLKKNIIMSFTGALSITVLLKHRNVLIKFLSVNKEMCTYAFLKLTGMILLSCSAVMMILNTAGQFFTVHKHYPVILIIYILFEIFMYIENNSDETEN